MILDIPPTLSQIRAGNLQVPLQFNADLTSQYDSTKTQILANGTSGVNLLIGVASTGYTLIKSGILNLFSAGSAVGAQNQNSWGVGVFGTSVGGDSYTGCYSTGLSDFIANVPTGSRYKLRVQGVEKYRLSAALAEFDRLSLGGALGSSTDGGAGSLALTNRVQFAGAGTASAFLSTMWADASAGNLFSNVPPAKYEQHRVGGAGLLSLGTAGGSTSAYNWSIGYYASALAILPAYSGIYAASGMVFNVPTLQFYQFAVNGIEKYRFSAALAEMDRISLGGTIGSSVDGGAGSLALTNRIQFAGTGVIDTTKTLIHADAVDGNMRIQAPVAKAIVDWIGAAQMFAVDAGGIYPGKGIIFSNSAGVANSAQTQIYADAAAGNLLINVPSTKSVALYVAGNQICASSAAGFKFSVGHQAIPQVKTTTYTATSADYILLGNHATVAFTITLPAATGSGQILIIKNINAAVVTVDGNASETIDGSLTQALALNAKIKIVDYAAGLWAIIGQ